jgi:FkbM family methyltransferase
MTNVILTIYRALFAKRFFLKWNKLMFLLSLRGLGILNYENDSVSGEDHFIRQLGKERGGGEVFFDVGANVGNYCGKLKQHHPSANVFAFEPHPRNFAELSSRTQALGITSIQMGCSDVSGQLTLYDYKYDDSGQHASLYKEVIEQIHSSETVAITVDVTTIDEFAQQHKIEHINLLKIDTEGNELKVLLGAKNLLSKQRIDIIHFEFNEMNVASRVYFKDFVNLLEGFTFYRMLPDSLMPLKEYNPILWELFAFQNIVATRKGFSI